MNVVGNNLLIGLIVDLNSHLLAEILQRDLFTQSWCCIEVPDFVGPLLEFQVVGNSPFKSDGIVLGTSWGLAAATWISTFTVFDHFCRTLEHADLADTCHETPIPPDTKFKVLVGVVPRGILSKLCHRMNTSLYT